MGLPIIQTLIAISLGCCLLLSGCKQQSYSDETNAETSPDETTRAQITEPLPTKKEHIQTILVMGLDKFEMSSQEIGYLNDQQSDFLMLLVVDEKAGTCQILHLNRDTMTEIRRLGVGGSLSWYPG